MEKRSTMTLRELLEAGELGLSPGILDALPRPRSIPLPDFDRVRGMLLGLAIGDALGNTTEARLPGRRRAEHGEIRDYLPNRHAGGRPVGVPSDDSQLAFWTLEHLLEHGRIVPERLAETFASREIFAIGHAVAEFRRALASGAPWYRAAQPSAGNGAVMRIAPVLVPHLRDPSPRLWEDAIVAAAVTHADRSSIAACVALVGMLRELLSMRAAPEPEWWLDRYLDLARPIEGDVQLKPRKPDFDYRGPVWRLVDGNVRAALASDLDVRAAGEVWYSGAYLLETIPSALYVLARHGADPEQAIVRAVNDTKDNDTIAAIVGACVGALHGASALPPRWIDGLLGRTSRDDDGRVFELVEQARARWCT